MNVRAAAVARAAEANTASRPLFECVGVGVSFGGLTAVDDVSLRVDKGEIVGIIGPNGAGKTTLFNVISGFLLADAGRILLDGCDLTRLLTYERAWLGLGRTFQQALLYPNLTVIENLLIAAHTHARRGLLGGALRCPGAVSEEREAIDRVVGTMEVIDVSDYWEVRAGVLSYGTLRMVELACLLVQRPRLLLLDEPASGIAQRETEALGPLLRRVRDRTETTILLIEHDMPLVSSLSDRIYAMDLGRVIAEGTPKEVLSHPEVVASYLGSRATGGMAWRVPGENSAGDAVGRSSRPSRNREPRRRTPI